MRKGRGVRRGHDRHDRSRNRSTASVDGEWRPARTSFRVRDESRPEGRSFGPQGRMPPIGLWAVGTNEPHARDKTVHGRRRRRMAADMDKFPHLGRKPSREALIQLTGANAGHRVGNDLREAGTDKFPRSGRKPSRGALVRFFAGSRVRVRHGACITCNTYSVPYKGKGPKKRLSPKQVNTLIHSYVTFYKTLIFQYLSLWKSVFSSN